PGFASQAFGLFIGEDVSSGTLLVEFPENGAGAAGDVSTGPLPDPVQGVIKLGRPPASAETKTLFISIGTSGAAMNGLPMIMGYSGGQMLAAITSPGLPVQGKEIPFDLELHRWWRVRHANQKAFFEVSNDGASWQPYYEAADGSPTAPLKMSFGG